MKQVIISGAGPAGLYTAIRLRELTDYKVIVFERNKELKPVCAGGIGLGRLGVANKIQIPDDIIQAKIRRAVLKVNNVESVIRGEGYVVDRYLFDKHLLEIAKSLDTDVKMGIAVNGFIEYDGHITADLNSGDRVDADYGVFADGVSSIYLTSQLDDKKYNLAKTYQIYLKPKEKFYNDDEIILDFTSKYVKTGYVWIFPADRYVKIGVGALLAEKKNLKLVINQYLSDHNIDGKIIAVMGKPLPSSKPITLFLGNIAAVGDAAGLTDPLTGAGILNALFSADKLADAIANDNLQIYRDNMSELISYNKKMYRLRNILITEADEMRETIFRETGDIDAGELEDRIKKIILSHPKLLLKYVLPVSPRL